MDSAWVEQWRDDMRAGTQRLVGEFEGRFGFPPGEHRVDGPADAAELDGLAAAGVPDDLQVFYRVVGEVGLPDVNNGYWIRRPPEPGDDHGYPTALSDGREIVVFGSDGGGAMFALAAGSGTPVYRLADGILLNDTYDTDGAAVFAEDLQAFLTFLRDELTDFLRP